MAKGGSGDVLTGIIAGFIAQSPDHLLNAVLAAVYVHGLSGDLAAQEQGERSVLAGDLVERISHAIQASTDFDNRQVQLTQRRAWKKR